jgi:serine/threonine-protein kinase
MKSRSSRSLRIGSRLGKYRLDARIGEGGFAAVYAATDTLLSIRVALKIPLSENVTDELLDAFRREARLTMRLDHPGILPIRDASIIDEYLVIVTPLANGTLAERLTKRISFATGFDIVEQMLSAVASAHQAGVIHCDIKPENILLFDENQARLGDFGIARAALKTIQASGAGTIGHMAPEQAMGKPSARSDVFSLGLLAHRMFSGKWPEYPFAWPCEGHATLRKKCHPDLIGLVKRAIEVEPRKRFRDAGQMLSCWQACRLKSLRFSKRHLKPS